MGIQTVGAFDGLERGLAGIGQTFGEGLHHAVDGDHELIGVVNWR